MLDLITIIKEVYSHYLKSVQEQNTHDPKYTTLYTIIKKMRIYNASSKDCHLFLWMPREFNCPWLSVALIEMYASLFQSATSAKVQYERQAATLIDNLATKENNLIFFINSKCLPCSKHLHKSRILLTNSSLIARSYKQTHSKWINAPGIRQTGHKRNNEVSSFYPFYV